MNIVIVGAGIAGLAIGWRLAERGAAVEILERGIAGRGATWASAGMLAPGAELGRDAGALTLLARHGRALWPHFAAELEAASAIRTGYTEPGSLILAQTEERARTLRQLAQDSPAEAVWLPAADLRKREPLLSHALLGALLVPSDAQVDNRALGEALRQANLRRGVRVRELCRVRSLFIENARAKGVVTAEGTIAADAVILACGAWLTLIGGAAPGELPPVRPAKGQMAAFEMPEQIPLPSSLLWGDEVYLVPRGKRLFVGATVEDAGFDTSVTREAHDKLIAGGVKLIPSLGGWTLAEMWAGLRPRPPDDAPILGETRIAGLFIAGGQFRNGILFAPAIAELMRDMVLGQAVDRTVEAFDPRRFGVR